MNPIEFCKKAVTHPEKIVTQLGRRGLLNWMSDERYLKILYRLNLKKKLNLDDPQTFNEKLQWLKLYDRKPEYTTMVDKYEAKKYVAERIGEEYIIPTLGVWDKFENIDFDALPDQFVLKCTHDSGGLVICKDKSKLNIEAARKKINKSLKQNFFYFGREWPYKNVKPRIIAEKYMVDESGYELKDYKLFSFDGFAKVMFIATDRGNPDEETKFDFFDMDFKHLPFTNGHPNSDAEIKRPESFGRMKEVAEKLSEGIPQVRVDLYDVNGQVYFGEMTFAHWSGLVPFNPEEWDAKFGEWIKLPDTIGGGYLLASSGFILWLHEEESGFSLAEFVDSKPRDVLPVYKFFCFDGEPRIIQAIQNDKQKNETIDYFDTEWNSLDMRTDCPNSEKPLPKPDNLKEMVQAAHILSKDKKGFIRVDLYKSKDKIYFSEYTFYSDCGMVRYDPAEWDLKLGEMVELSNRGGCHPISEASGVIQLGGVSEEDDLRDYKFYCFDGVVKVVMIASNRFTGEQTCFDYFDRDYHPITLTWGKPNSEIPPQKPGKFDEMLKIAETLSKGITFVRVDLYECEGRVYLGELTFFDDSGFGDIEPKEWEYTLGEWLKLPETKRGGG